MLLGKKEHFVDDLRRIFYPYAFRFLLVNFSGQHIAGPDKSEKKLSSHPKRLPGLTSCIGCRYVAVLRREPWGLASVDGCECTSDNHEP